MLGSPILFVTLASLAAAAILSPEGRAAAACGNCNLDCSQEGTSIGVPRFCAFIDNTPRCVQAAGCGGEGGGIGKVRRDVFGCGDGFYCAPDNPGDNVAIVGGSCFPVGQVPN